MAIIEEIVAKGLTQAWGMMTPAQRADIRAGTMAGEKGLNTFNAVTADDVVDPTELEAAINEILAAGGSTAGRAIQAYFWSLFKSG